MSSPSGKDHHGANDQDSNVLEYGDNDFDNGGDEHHVDVDEYDKHIYHGARIIN